MTHVQQQICLAEIRFFGNTITRTHSDLSNLPWESAIKAGLGRIVNFHDCTCPDCTTMTTEELTMTEPTDAQRTAHAVAHGEIPPNLRGPAWAPRDPNYRDLPAPDEGSDSHRIVVIEGMSSHVCCRGCGMYFDARDQCPRCKQAL